jgi:tetratricopeptide (TPR) repeat protein/serine/threonine protein kinase
VGGTERLERAWRGWRPGEPPPRWSTFLPEPGQALGPDAFYLVQLDVELRVKAGLPALLAEPYFDDPRLRLDDTQRLELVRWEYQLRWQNGQCVRRSDYQAAFPQHADALGELRPRWHCPGCRHAVVADEDEQGATLLCPNCGSDHPAAEVFPPRAAKGGEAEGLDLRHYELLEQLGAGGMGEVYRARDPGLGRDLAIKVMRSAYRGSAEAEARFLREARITGALEHPAVVPVHNVGRLPDGRLYLTMKLVRGQTLDRHLAGAAGQRAEQMPQLLPVFEKACQAVGYAHSRGVIHRDLKPANVMVGAFGEVQVMDWGLAKTLASQGREPLENGAVAPVVSPGAHAPGSPDTTRPGAVVGTPAYLAPEQARGEEVDERADVFGLGAILCEALTGRPPFPFASTSEVLDRAAAGDLGEAFARLDGCGADPGLVALARDCLAPEREHRPRDGGAVADRVTAYLAGVQERLRQAELERRASEARAEEAQAKALAERRARRLLLGLGAALLLMMLAGGGAAWLWQRQRAEAEARERGAGQRALLALERARERLREGWQANDLARLKEARKEADRAAEIADGGAAEEVRREVAEARAEVEARLARAEKNRALLAALLDVAAPREVGAFERSDQGVMVALAQPSLDEQFAAAFRRWGLDLDRDPEGEARARLKDQPAPVLEGIVAGLDSWALERKRRQRPEPEWRRLLRLAEDVDGSATHRRLRALLAGTDRGRRWQVQELRTQFSPVREPVQTVLLLAQVCREANDLVGAEQVLRQALAARPHQVVLLDALGRLLEGQGRARLGEAIECYRAARAVRPELGIALSQALSTAGRGAEAEVVLLDLDRQQPNHPEIHFFLGIVLRDQQKPGKAVDAYRKAIALQPNFPSAYTNLGQALHDQKKLEEAAQAFRRAIALQPDLAMAHNNLGVALLDLKKPAEAEKALRKAIHLQPGLALAHNNLGTILLDRKRPAEAEKALRRAIRLQPDYPSAHYNLGIALHDQKKLDGAIQAYRKAVDLEPRYAKVYNNLGIALHAQGKVAEAEKAFRRAIELRPDLADAHNSLGIVLHGQKRTVEAVKALRRAIQLRPNYPLAYSNLGIALRELKKFEEAVHAFRTADRLLPGRPNVRANLREAEHLLRLDRQLTACLAGKDCPAAPKERLELARFCGYYRERPRTALRFCLEAFKDEPGLADDLEANHRYNAACFAVLAAAGKEKEAGKLADRERADLRQKALAWLRADLTGYANLLEHRKDGLPLVRRRLALWLTDADLASVREPASLAALPGPEGPAWRSFWVEVVALHKRAAKAP